jgi:hypothetical protein
LYSVGMESSSNVFGDTVNVPCRYLPSVYDSHQGTMIFIIPFVAQALLSYQV